MVDAPLLPPPFLFLRRVLRAKSLYGYGGSIHASHFRIEADSASAYEKKMRRIERIYLGFSSFVFLLFDTHWACMRWMDGWMVIALCTYLPTYLPHPTYPFIISFFSVFCDVHILLFTRRRAHIQPFLDDAACKPNSCR